MKINTFLVIASVAFLFSGCWTVSETEYPDVEVAVVKKAEGRYCAKCLPQAESHKLLFETAKKAVETIAGKKPVAIPEKIMMEVTFQQTCMADGAERVTGTKRTGPMTVTYECSSMREYTRMRQVIFLAAAEFYDRRFEK